MTNNEILLWVVAIAPALAAAGGLVGALLVKNWLPARETAVAGADYVEAVKEAVEAAERYGAANKLPGFDKFAVAVRRMDLWLDTQGIHGDAARVTMERVKADIELMRARLYPKAPTP